MMIKSLLRATVRKARQWLAEPAQPAPPPPPFPPFDNNTEWLRASFRELMKDPVCARRQHYLWGVLQGAALGKVLGLPRLSLIELGIGQGAGLLALEHAAAFCEKHLGITLEIYGFSTGIGQPKPKDYRDLPYRWSEHAYSCDREALQRRLQLTTTVTFGLVEQTIPAFLRAADYAPIAFLAYELGYYSSTVDALALCDAPAELMLPRTPVMFRTVTGPTCCEFTGERLAIHEFNVAHASRKLSQILGLVHFVPPEYCCFWPDTYYLLHVFDHPLYDVPEAYQQSFDLPIEGGDIYKPVAEIRRDE